MKLPPKSRRIANPKWIKTDYPIKDGTVHKGTIDGLQAVWIVKKGYCVIATPEEALSKYPDEPYFKPIQHHTTDGDNG